MAHSPDLNTRSCLIVFLITHEKSLIFLFYFSKFWCSNQTLSVADFGWRVHHIKLLISSCLQNLCLFKLRFKPLPLHLLETRSLGLSVTVQTIHLLQYSRGRCQDVNSPPARLEILRDRPDQLCRTWFHTVSDLEYSVNPLTPIFLQQAYWHITYSFVQWYQEIIPNHVSLSLDI